MAASDKVLINLATGLEDGERVLVAFLVATAAQQQGKEVVVWATKDAVRLGLPGELEGVVCKDCPPLERLWEQFTEAGGELWLCPICLAARDLGDAETVASVKVAGATPMWEWAGSDATVFSYWGGETLMVLGVREPVEFARQVEEHPRLPAAGCERVSGYGVMGLPFGSGHVLGLRRWTASSVGEGFTSIWHRDPAGRWTFYETAPSEIACTRYFGGGVDQVRVVPITVEWEGPRRLHVSTADGAVEWTIEVGSTAITRVMSIVGSALPLAAWRSRPLLSAMGRVAGWSLRVGTVKLTGMTSNQQRFDANPLRIWFVIDSHAVVEGQELGPIGPLAEQAHLTDFYIPQRGIFAIGRVFVTPVPARVPAAVPATEVAQ